MLTMPSCRSTSSAIDGVKLAASIVALSRFLGLAVLLAGLVAGAGVLWRRADVEAVIAEGRPPAAAPVPAPAASIAGSVVSSAPPPHHAPVVDIDWHAPQLRRRDRLTDAGQRSPMRVEMGAHGIRCPDGRCLPLLNGVASAPAMIREPERGPLPAVIALVVDADGWEWYEHADGSMTTSRPQRTKDQLGREAVQTVTLHVATLPADALVAPPTTSPSQPPLHR